MNQGFIIVVIHSKNLQVQLFNKQQAQVLVSQAERYHLNCNRLNRQHNRLDKVLESRLLVQRLVLQRQEFHFNEIQCTEHFL